MWLVGFFHFHGQASWPLLAKLTPHHFVFRDLHVFRGHEKVDETGFTMGHEFTGKVIAAGTAVTMFKLGDNVVVPFTTSWSVMVYCAIKVALF